MRLAIAALALLAGPAWAEDCPAERAVYAMHSPDDGDFRAQFIPSLHMASVASDLYFKLTTGQRSYWFGFSASNGYGGTMLMPISDPYQDAAKDDGPRNLLGEPAAPEDEEALMRQLAQLRFVPLDANLMETASPPSSGQPAPPYIIMPELGIALWYGASALTEDAGAERDPLPRGVFKLAECLKDAPAKAWP